MAAMASFATPTDMDQRSQGAITAATHPWLQKELDAATRAIQGYCGWHIALVETLTRKHRSRRWSEIWIPAMQITAAKITTLDGVDHQLADDEFDPETGWTSWSGDRYILEYTAGYTPVPDDIIDLTLQIAARALGSPLGFVREQAGTVSVTHSQASFNVAGGTVILEHEKTALAEYRLGRLP